MTNEELEERLVRLESLVDRLIDIHPIGTTANNHDVCPQVASPSKRRKYGVD